MTKYEHKKSSKQDQEESRTQAAPEIQGHTTFQERPVNQSRDVDTTTPLLFVLLHWTEKYDGSGLEGPLSSHLWFGKGETGAMSGSPIKTVPSRVRQSSKLKKKKSC